MARLSKTLATLDRCPLGGFVPWGAGPVSALWPYPLTRGRSLLPPAGPAWQLGDFDFPGIRAADAAGVFNRLEFRKALAWLDQPATAVALHR